ncbi:S1C family serine protease [Nakamurella sp.]|uniref:S1C family serine protease n=1 Tax=Nakamurella sp. TaxID=1869182 RepID=UPI003B3AB83F
MYQPAPAPPAPPVPPRHRTPLMVAGALGIAAVVGIAAALGGTTQVAGTPTAVEGIAAAATLPDPYGSGSGGSSGSGGQSLDIPGFSIPGFSIPGFGDGSTGTGDSGGSGGTGGTGGTGGGYGYGDGGGTTGDGSSEVPVTTAQQVGLVYIDTQLAYQDAAAAGTGLVLTSDGTILTNNHVIAGSTSILVTVVSSGKTYRATVVGADVKDDIAVLQLTDASGLTTANVGTSQNVAVGDAVTGVGNAGGDGGTPSAAAGVVSALNRTITTQAEGAAAGETLTGLIETTADIQSGDSGGPLFNADDQVIGIDTAASEVSGQSVNGYAIPIDTALGIARQIVAGDTSGGATLGYPAFLGVQVQSATTATGTGRDRSGAGTSASGTSGAVIAGVVDGSPAAGAGLVAGDTVVGIDATAVTSADGLSAALAGHRPGDSVTVTWVDASGARQSADVVLIQGPAA